MHQHAGIPRVSGYPKFPLKGEIPQAEGLSDGESQVTWEGTPEGFQRATADFVCFHCPLVAPAGANPLVLPLTPPEIETAGGVQRGLKSPHVRVCF